MKKPSSFLKPLTIILLMTGLFTGCSRAGNEMTPQGTYRIEQLMGRSTSSGAVTTYQTTYTYDSQGNLTKTAATSDKRAVTGTYGNQLITKTTVYTYDPDGYVLTSVTDELNQTTTDKVTSEKSTTTESYSYTSGRLSGQTVNRVGAYGVTTITTYSFAYDGMGNLATKTASTVYIVHDPTIAKEVPVGSGTGTQVWQYRNNQLVDYVQKSGNSEYRSITIQNGLVTKFMSPGNTGDYVVAYTYDAQQRLIALDESVGGQPTNAFTQTWSDAKPAEATLSPFKGWPNTLPEYGKGGVMLNKQTRYYNSVSGKTETYSEQTASVTTNAQGFVTASTTTANYPNPAAAPQNYTDTETYTYSGCQ